ncbi:hypothetical protein MRX96_032304 [Rhipicephalus microplus]
MALAPSSSSVKTHRALSLKIKECVIRDIMSGLKKVSVAAEYGVSDTTVSTIYKNKDKLRQDSSSLSRKRIQALEDYEQSDTSLADETLNTDDVWSCLVDSNIVAATDTFQDVVDAGESELSVCQEASTDYAIVAAVRGSAEVATDDEDDVDPTPEPDFPAVRKHCQTKITAFFR